jgi:hypothetical protein
MVMYASSAILELVHPEPPRMELLISVELYL